MRLLAAAALLALVSCAPATPPELTDFPDPSTLPEQSALPDLFLSATSTDRATTKEAFDTWRKPQLAKLFSHYVYGFTPPKQPVTATKTSSYPDLIPGATWDEYTLTLDDNPNAQLHLAFIRPNNTTNFPVILGLNKCGNHSLTTDPRVRTTTSLVIPACSPDRGSQQSLWPLARIVARGYAVATFHESDAAPDDDVRFADGLRSQFRPDTKPATAWATLAIWAWALAHAATWLDTLPDVDHDRITVFGHSRRGKAALLAGTLAPEIDSVVAHQSGTGGSALNRSYEGETIALITNTFPHWFDANYRAFADRENTTPVDQHELLALWAPRRVVLTDGDDDAWADPQGSRQSAEAAAPAWDLYGSTQKPTWQTRPGGHSVEPSDWELFLDALER